MQKSCQLRALDKDQDTSQKVNYILNMGIQLSRPEFVYILADKQVKSGQDFTLTCKTNTRKLTATWEKKGQRLMCVAGKHKTRISGKTIFLKVKNADMGDEGQYTVTIENNSGRTSCSALVIVELCEWRTIQWRQAPKIHFLKEFRPTNRGVKELRFLLCGPVGAGKSSIINTIKTIFENQMFINCQTESDLTSKSCTKKYVKYNFLNVPFTFYDVMGMEDGVYKGVHPDDIINALKGHLPNNYIFKENDPIDEENRYYNLDPTLNDQIHCLVSVIAADTIVRMDDKVIQKMRTVRREAYDLGIPQILFLTRVDRVCTMTQQDLTKVYQSKKIREKMMECSSRLGFTMNCIFPVKNYSEERNPDEKVNCLMLDALTQTVHAANDFVNLHF